MPPPPAARDRVLDAFERLLVDRGERAATLDAVAREAGVSKGGLIYHFPSREAMVDGLLDRMRERAQEDLAAMVEAQEGAVAYFLRTSQCAGTPFDRTLIAATRLRSHASARESLAVMQRQWFDALLGFVGDETIAQMVMLMGDGFYYNASAPDALAGAGSPQDRARVDDMVELVSALVRLRSADAPASGPGPVSAPRPASASDSASGPAGDGFVPN